MHRQRNEPYARGPQDGDPLAPSRPERLVFGDPGGIRTRVTDAETKEPPVSGTG